MRLEVLNPFKWVSIFRITAITVILGIGVYFLRNYPFYFSVIPLLVIIGITHLLTFIYWNFVIKGKFTPLILWTSVVIDVFIISAIVYYTGGIKSEFVFLYLFPIVEASIFFFLKGSATISTLCLGSYCVVIVLEFYQLIPTIPGIPKTTDIWILYTNLYLGATLFYLIAVTSGYLGERMRQKALALEQVKLDTSTILQSIKSGLIVLDYKGNILYKNTLAEKILGVNIKDSIKELNPTIRDLISDLYDAGIKKIITFASKVIGIHTSKLQGKSGENRGVVVVLDDLTESIITERLAAIGKFSGDLAHEIRNPLTTIQGACELLKEGVEEEEGKKLLDNILFHTDRLNRIVANFLSFTNPMPLKLEEVRIEEIIKEAISLAPDKVTVQLICDNGLKLKLDKEQMRTAFLNLIINAYEAMDGNGEIRITVTPPLHKYLLFEDERMVEEDEVVVSFKDFGKGIKDSEITKIFTPFYTTKKGGVGLGLSIVSKIIEAHKGRIEVKSKLGDGTIFAIHLPYNSL